MSHTLEQFAADCHRILKAEPGPEGREKVVSLVADVCKDDEFIAEHIEEDQPERKVIYEDENWASASSRTTTRAPRAATPTTTVRRGPSTARPRARPR